jgi:isoleucyl-tRNA synthetase
MRRIEEVRATGKIGSSLAAELDIYAHGNDLAFLRSLNDDLRFVMIVSRASVHEHEGEVVINVSPAGYEKCERCWHHRADVGQNTDHPTLCGRCTSNLFETGEPRHYA